jgi:hypothetical protein
VKNLLSAEILLGPEAYSDDPRNKMMRLVREAATRSGCDIYVENIRRDNSLPRCEVRLNLLEGDTLEGDEWMVAK